MSMHEIPELDTKGLRNFGLMLAGFVTLVFGIGFPWLLDKPFPVWPWVIGAISVAWALIAPQTMRGFYRGWMKVAMFIGLIINKIILGFVFYCVVLPIGLVAKLWGKDPMRRAIESQFKTYRVTSKAAARKNLERPF